MLTRSVVTGVLKPCYEFRVGRETYGIAVANDLESRKRAYRLLYEIYGKQGYGEAHPSGLWFSLFDMLPTTVTLLVTQGAREVGAVTMVGDSALGLPADTIYRKDLDIERAEGCRPTEVMSLGVRTDLRGSRGVLSTLMNVVMITGRHGQGSTHLAITIVPHHAAFYEDQWYFVRKGEIGFHKKTGVHCALLLSDLAAGEKMTDDPRNRRMVARYRIPAEEKPGLVRRFRESVRPVSGDEAAFLLKTARPEIWARATPGQRRHVTDVLGLDCRRIGLEPAPSSHPARLSIRTVADPITQDAAMAGRSA